jgi:putative transposase
MLERRGKAVNVKRVYWLYAEEGLAVRRRRRKRLVRDRVAELRLIRANQEWPWTSALTAWRTDA